MKSIETFLSDLANQDIKLWMDGDRLRCYAPQGVLTADMQTELKSRRVEIIQFLEQLGSEHLGYVERPSYRPITKFETRGIKLGHGVWDLVYRKN
jgi:tRNA G46 methylase TrmB